ncbi:MAG: hypothetical protein E7Z89_08445 [Cyanobacteria bacterium SIG28]|nr:hypothetical protein [Cyanobacteria bacterium SIG28]
MGYQSDREFTNYIHETLAIPKIYDLLKWKKQNMDAFLANNVDMNNAVDRFLIDLVNQKIITVQERFREQKYQYYNDFTIRYEREHNIHSDRKKSEFFKLNADYFVYGIINSSKYKKEEANDFIKFAVIDIKVLKALFDDGLIEVDKTLNSIKCVSKNGKIICPVNHNKDNSSSFIPIDIKLLLQLFSDKKVVLLKKGF